MNERRRAQKLGGTGHGVNIKILALSPLFVRELKYWVVQVSVLEDDTGDLEQGPA